MEEQDFIPDEPDFIPDDEDFIPDVETPSNRTPSPMEQMIMDEFNPRPRPSALSRIWEAMSTPLTDLPSRIGRSAANLMDDPNAVPEENYLSPDNPLSGLETFGRGVNKNIRQFLAGSTEGAGNLISSMTSPIDLGAAALSGGSSLAARAGLPTAAKGLRGLSGAMSAPVALHGASSIYEGATEGDLAQMGQGALELAGGAAGMTQLLPNTPDIPRTADDLPPVTPITNKPTTIYVKPSDTAIADIKKATEMGYEHAGLDDRGRVKMIFSRCSISWSIFRRIINRSSW